MFAVLVRLNPFKTADARRLAFLFGVVYFSQGMWNLPAQPVTLMLKERWGLSAGQVATFFSIGTIPWLIKPVYGLLSDFVPLFGRRRKSYLVLASALAFLCAATVAITDNYSYWWLAIFFAGIGLGLAINDVMVDALMVENGRPRGLTGAFQSVQWASIYCASMVVGLLGGYLAGRRSIHTAFALTALFPLCTLGMAAAFVREAPAQADREAFRATLAAIREAVGQRQLWVVAGFILFFTFSPSIGTPLFYHQTDNLKFSQQFIGVLTALSSGAAVIGALAYAPLSRRVPLRRLINLAIGIAVVGTLAYLGYQNATAAIIIDVTFGCVGMITQLAFLDLAAKSCPRRIEGTFFALLMSVYNGGVQGSQIVGGYLYDDLGYARLVIISAVATALTFALVPFVRVDTIEARARGELPEGEPATLSKRKAS